MIKELIRGIDDTQKIRDENKAEEGGKNTDKINKLEKQSTKSAGKAGKKGKEDKSRKISEQKFSDELSEAEENSFRTFTKKKGEFCYDVINIKGNSIDMAPSSTAVLKIGFGLPNILLERKQEELRKLSEKQKDKGKAGKGGKAGKKSGSTKSSKKEKEVKGGKLKPLPEDQVYHVTKYNILLNKTFLKDFILISTFIG